LFQDVQDFETLSADTATINNLLGNVSLDEVSQFLGDGKRQPIDVLVENLDALAVEGNSPAEVRIVNCRGEGVP